MTRHMRTTRVTRVPGLPDDDRAGAGSPRGASVTGRRSGTARTLRRRDRALARGDRVALAIGIALSLLMLAWLGWTFTQTVARDRAVRPGMAPAPAMPGH